MIQITSMLQWGRGLPAGRKPVDILDGSAIGKDPSKEPQPLGRGDDVQDAGDDHDAETSMEPRLSAVWPTRTCGRRSSSRCFIGAATLQPRRCLYGSITHSKIALTKGLTSTLACANQPLTVYRTHQVICRKCIAIRSGRASHSIDAQQGLPVGVAVFLQSESYLHVTGLFLI